MFDVVDGCGQRALERRHDAARHLVGRQTGILPDHPDHRNPDFRKDVGRRPQGRQRPHDQKKKCQHDESIRSAQCNSDQRIHIGLFSVISGAALHPQERPVLLTLFLLKVIYPNLASLRNAAKLTVACSDGKIANFLKVSAINVPGEETVTGSSGSASQSRPGGPRRFPAGFATPVSAARDGSGSPSPARCCPPSPPP